MVRVLPLSLAIPSPLTWSDSFPDIANLLNRSAKAIEVINQKISKSETIEATNFGHPLIWLAEGINRIVYASIPESAEQWDLFSNSWVVPENVDEMTKFVYGDFRISGNKSQLLGTLHNHAKAISQLIGLLSDQVISRSFKDFKIAPYIVSASEVWANVSCSKAA